MSTRGLSFGYALVITGLILIASILGNPRPNYYDRNENPELSQWAEQHKEQVNEMANRLRTEYNRAIRQQSGQNIAGGTTACKTTCIPSTTWMSYTGKTKDEINHIAKEMTIKLVNDLNSGKIEYNQISQPNWFENYAANELHILQNQHHQNNFGAQIHIPQGTYYHKTEKKQVYEYTEGGNIQPTFIYKPTVTTYEEKNAETREHSSSGYPTVYYGHGPNIEKIEKRQEEHKDFETIAHVPVYTDSYFHSSDRKKVNRRPTAAPAIHVSYNSQEENVHAQHAHHVYPTATPVTVTHKEHHTASVEKHTIPIIYNYGNNERRSEQTHQRNRTSTHRRPAISSTNSTIQSRKNSTTTQVETHTRRPTIYSERKHNIYRHLKTEDGIVPNYKPRVVYKESKVRDYYGFGEGSETVESHTIQNHTTSTTNQQNTGQAQISYRPAYVGHQSRYNRTHGHNYTRPGYVIPGGTSQTTNTSQITESVQQNRPRYVVLNSGSGNSQTSSKKIEETVQHTKPGFFVIGGGTEETSQTSESSQIFQKTGRPTYVVTGSGSQNIGSAHSSQSEQQTHPGYVVMTGGGRQTSDISQSSQLSQHATQPGYIITGGTGGRKVIKTSYVNHTTQEMRPGYVVIPGTHSTQISQTSQSSEEIIQPGYIVHTGGAHSSQTNQTSQSSQQIKKPGYVSIGGGGSQTVETSHSSQISQEDKVPGYLVVTGGGSQTVESSHTSQTSQQEKRPGYLISGGGGSQTVESIHSGHTSQQSGHPGYVVVTGGAGSQTVESFHTNHTSQQNAQPGYIVTAGGGSQTVESSHSSQILQQGGRPGGFVVVGTGSQTVESSHKNETSQHGARPGYVITGGGGQTIQTTHSSQTSEHSGRPGGYVVVTGGGLQTVESIHTSETSHEDRQPEFIITGVGSSQIVETTHSETIQESGHPGYVVVTGGGQSQTVEKSNTSKIIQEGSKEAVILIGGGQTVETTHFNQTLQQSGIPGYVVIAGGKGSQTIKTSQINQTSEHGRPGFIITSGGGSQTIHSTHTNQSSEHTRPGHVIIGGGSQSVETVYTNQSAQETTRPGFVITTGSSQTIESTHTNQTSQHSQPGYVVIGSGGQSSGISQANQTLEQISKPGYIAVGGGFQTIQSNHSSQTTEQSSRPGYIITGEGGSQTSQISQTSHSENNTGPGYVVIGGGGQTSQTSFKNQTTEQTSRPGYIITGEGSHTVETSQISESSHAHRPGFVVVGGEGSQISEASQSNHSSIHGNPGFVVIGSGNSQNYSQEFISQLNQTGDRVQIANGSYISGLGFQEVKTNWTSTTTNKRPYLIISKDRGDQPPHQFEDYYDEETLETEPGIGLYPTGKKPEIGLLLPGQLLKTNHHQLNIHGSHGTHNTHSQSSHTNQKNHETHVYPGSSVTHKHHTHTIGTLPGDSRPLLEDHHVDKQLVEGSSHTIHSSQNDITDNELRRESYGFNKSKHHHHESDEHRNSGIRHGQHQHSHSIQHHSGSSQQHAHRHHHGEDRGDTEKTKFFTITRDGRRQNVSRHEHEEVLKSQINLLIESFAQNIEQDIQSISPEEDKDAMQVEIVYDNMEELLLRINKLVGNDPDTKHIIEQLVQKELEPYQRKYRVKRSFLNLRFGFGSQKTKATEPTEQNTDVNIASHLENELFNTGVLPGNTYNPYDVTQTHNTLDTQTSNDLIQQTQTEDLLQFSSGLFTNQLDKSTDSITLNQELAQQHLEEDFSALQTPNEQDTQNLYDLTQQTQTDDLSQLSLGLTNQDSTQHLENLSTFHLNNKTKNTDIYSGAEEDDDQQTINEDLTEFLGSNQHFQNLDTQKHIGLSLSTEQHHTLNNEGKFHDNSLQQNRPGYPLQQPSDINYSYTGEQIYDLNYAPKHPIVGSPPSKPYEISRKPFDAGLLTNVPQQSGSEHSSGSIYESHNVPKQQIVNPINQFDISSIYETHHIQEQTNRKPTEQHHTHIASPIRKDTYYPNYKPTNLIKTINQPSSFIKPGNNIPPENIKVPEISCWQPESPNYQPIGSKMNITFTDSQNTESPCPTVSASLINPVYTNIDVLQQPIGTENLLESTKPTNIADPLEHASRQEHNRETELNHSDEQFTIGNLQTTYSEGQFTVDDSHPYYPGLPNYGSHYTQKQQTVNRTEQSGGISSKPVVGSNDSDEQLTTDILQSTYQEYPVGQFYELHSTSNQTTEKSINQSEMTSFKPMISAVYHPGTSGETIYDPHAIPKQPIDRPVAQYDPIPSTFTTEPSATLQPDYPERQFPIYNSHQTPKQPTVEPNQSEPNIMPVYKPGTIPETHVDDQFTVNIPQSGYLQYPAVYKPHDTLNQPGVEKTDTPKITPPKTVDGFVYSPRKPSQTTDSDGQLSMNVQQPNDLGYHGGTIYDTFDISKQATPIPKGHPDVIPSKPATDLIYSERPIYKPHYTPTQQTEIMNQSEVIPSKPGIAHPTHSIYNPHYVPKHSTAEPTVPSKVIASKPVDVPIYSSGTPSQPVYLDGQYSINELQLNGPGESFNDRQHPPKQPASAYATPYQPLDSDGQISIGINSQQKSGIDYQPISNSHFATKNLTVRPTNQVGVTPSQTNVGLIDNLHDTPKQPPNGFEPKYSSGIPKLTQPDEQFTVDTLQSSYHEYSKDPIYNSHYIPKQPTVEPKEQSNVIPRPLNNEGKFHDNSLQQNRPGYPLQQPSDINYSYTGEQIHDFNYAPKHPIVGSAPSKPYEISRKPIVPVVYTDGGLLTNVPQQSGSEHSSGSIYESHNVPKQQIVNPINQFDISSPKPEEQFTVDILQPSYPESSGSIYETHHIREQTNRKPTDQSEVSSSKPVIAPTHPIGTHADGQWSTDHSNYPGGPIYNPHYIPKQSHFGLINQYGTPFHPIYPSSTLAPFNGPYYSPNTVESRPIHTFQPFPPSVSRYPGKPTYDSQFVIGSKAIDLFNPTGATQTAHTDKQFTVDMLQSSNPRDQSRFPIYESHNNPKQQTIDPMGQPEIIPSKPIGYSSGVPAQPSDLNGQLLDNLQQSSDSEYPELPSYGQNYTKNLPTNSSYQNPGFIDKPVPGLQQTSNLSINRTLRPWQHQVIVNPSDAKPETESSTRQNITYNIDRSTQHSTNHTRKLTSGINSNQHLSKEQRTLESSGTNVNFPSYVNQYGGHKTRPGDISYTPIRHVFYPAPVAQPAYNSNTGSEKRKLLSGESLNSGAIDPNYNYPSYQDQQNSEKTQGFSNTYHSANQETINKHIIPTFEHSQTHDQFLVNQNAEINKESSVQQNNQHNTESVVPSSDHSELNQYHSEEMQRQTPLNQYAKQIQKENVQPSVDPTAAKPSFLASEHTNNVPQIIQENGQQFREQFAKPASGSTNTIKHYLTETEQARDTSNTQHITAQNPKSVESHTYNRRGDQISLDNEDYDDTSHEKNIITNTALYDVEAQNTLQLHDDFQYHGPDAELQQLTQKLTKEDFTNYQYPNTDDELQQITQKLTKEDFKNFVKSPEHSNRQ